MIKQGQDREQGARWASQGARSYKSLYGREIGPDHRGFEGIPGDPRSIEGVICGMD
jgi:hypothetical protein